MRTYRQAIQLAVFFVFVSFSVCAEGVPDDQKHRLGEYEVKAPGAPAKVYLQAAHDYGAKLDSDQLSAARRGDLKWMVDKGTDGVTYKIVAPKSYTPEEPHGVIVFISSSDKGRPPKPMVSLLGKHRLIGIGAHNSGNERDVVLRHAYAVHAVEMVAERYNVDPNRIYVSGNSGGGRVCSQVMIMNSDTFTGGMPFVGANACIRMPVADSKGAKFMDPGVWKNTDKNRLAKAGREGRFVFMTGSKDYNKQNVKSVYEGYKDAGFQYVHYIEQEGLGHGTPDMKHIEQGIEFMDMPLTKAAEDNYKDAKRDQESGRLGEALMLYRSSSLYGRNAEWYADAVAQKEALQAEYDKAIAAVEETIKSQDNSAFRRALQGLRRTWDPVADRDVLKDLTERFREAG